jgi:hypothetical protein
MNFMRVQCSLSRAFSASEHLAERTNPAKKPLFSEKDSAKSRR